MKILLDVKVILDRIETPKEANIKILHLSSKKENLEMIFYCPVRLLNTLMFVEKQELHFEIAKTGVNEKEAKFLAKAKVESLKKKEKQHVILILIGGIPLKIYLPPEKNKFHLEEELEIAIY